MRLWGGGPLLTRAETRLRWGVALGFPLAILCLVVPLGTGQTRRLVVTPAWGGAVVFSLVGAVCLWQLRSRLYQSMERLRAVRFRYCPGCCYDLRKSAPSGRCPECAREYTPDSLRAQWMDRYLGWLDRVTEDDEDV
jgi:hypothetical protein